MMKGILYLLLVATQATIASSTALADQMVLEPQEYMALASDTPESTNGAALRFDFSLVPAGARVLFAELTIVADADTSNGDVAALRALPAAAQWSATTSLSVSSIGTLDSLSTGTFMGTGNDRTTKFTLTRIVEGWLSGGIPNNGIIILPGPTHAGHFQMNETDDTVQASLKIVYLPQ